ncbi:extensin family protein [Rhodosalinus sp.]|uniref:extensin-like domain-containing protein n=1 Tax=Rhodosalinus sp. TaxID=2047741 RepID=UPI003978395A
MRGALRSLSFVAALLVAAPLAGAPDSSLRPVTRVTTAETTKPHRPVSRQEARGTGPAEAIAWTGPRPIVRPATLLPAAAPAAARPADGIAIATSARAVPHPGVRPVIAARAVVRGAAPISPEVPGLARSLRPQVRGEALVQRVMARRRALDSNSVCGDRDLQGVVVGRVKGHLSACGIEQAVQVHSVMGIGLTQPALLDCPTAQALKQWVRQGLKPAIGTRGGGVDRIRVAAHFVCRTRNHQSGAPLSEHSFGRAIDISAVRLRDGRWITVLDHWGGGAEGRALRQMHASACGIFGTVLGPASDRWHQGHFHFDTARHRGGAYCR